MLHVCSVSGCNLAMDQILVDQAISVQTQNENESFK